MKDINPCAAQQIELIRRRCSELQPKVAVLCTTYNHEAYVREALDGFVMQKTNFPFVVILHDDASTDNTVKIIKEYKEKYPDIFQCVFEEENQYSKPRPALGNILNAQIESTNVKYVAWCEGDDYWTDPNKLQMQFDFMESHPDYSMCVTNGKILDVPTGSLSESYHKFLEDQDLNMDDLILKGGSYLFTNSFFCRKDLYFVYNEALKLMYIGDYPTQILMRHLGKTRFLNTYSIVYRQNAVGSWTSIHAKHNDKLHIIQELRNYENMLNTIDLLTQNKYSVLLEQAIRHKRFELYLRANLLKDARYEWGRITDKSRYTISNVFDMYGIAPIYHYVKRIYRRIKYGAKS